MARVTTVALSTKVTWRAPLDSASIPQAPLPANRSRQSARTIVSCSQLNSVSRMRSGVGRSPSASGKLRRRLRHCPAMMRRLLPAADLDLVMHVFRYEMYSAVRALTTGSASCLSTGGNGSIAAHYDELEDLAPCSEIG